MQPADLATIRDALATVRELSVYDRECTDAEWASINIASRLLARELVRLIDAGEAVRVKGLEWVLDTARQHIDTAEKYDAQTVLGRAVLSKYHNFGKPYWELFIAGNGRDRLAAKTFEEAVEEAFGQYRTRLAAALEPLFAKEKPCPTCHGRRKVYEQSETGQDYGEWPCPTCCPEGKEAGK